MLRFGLEMICVPAQYRMTAITMGFGSVLAGVVLSSVLAGSFGVVMSILSGHPPVLSLLLYSLSGVCGALAFVWRALVNEDRAA